VSYLHPQMSQKINADRPKGIKSTAVAVTATPVVASKPTSRKRRTRVKEMSEVAIDRCKTSILSRLRRWHAWNTKFHLLKKFVSQKGVHTVPAALDTPIFPKLGAWVIEQRSALRADKLRIQAKRDELATAAAGGDAEAAKELAKMKKEFELASSKHYDFSEAAKHDGGSDHHHHGIPHIEKQNGSAAALRRIARLDSIGFDWGETRSSRWDRMFSLLKKYSHEHGDVLVPANFHTQEYPRLGVWVVAQRRAYRETVQTQAAQAAAQGNPTSTNAATATAGSTSCCACAR